LILKKFSENFSCPIHVIVEKSFDTYWKYSVSSTYKANSTLFYSPPLRTCTTKGLVPREHQLSSLSKEYLSDCLKPYKGRVKFWAIDIRRTSVFNLVSEFWIQLIYEHNADHILALLKTSDIYKRIYECTQKFIENILNVQLYIKNKNLYNDRIMKTISVFARHVVKLDSKKYPIYKNIEKVVKEIIRTGDKSHLDLGRSLSFLSDDILHRWKENILQTSKNNPLYTMLMIPLHDIYAILRMYRLIRKHQDGIILFFGGDWHTSNMSLLIKLLPSIKYRNDNKIYPIEYLGHINCYSNSVELPVPYLHCTTVIPSMKLFET